MNADPPPWFKGQPSAVSKTAEKMKRTCSMCGAPPGEKCRYMVGAGSHKDGATGKYVDNVAGEEMMRPHRQR